jgi:deoxyadenosine/deoxycytidine kinase
MPGQAGGKAFVMHYNFIAIEGNIGAGKTTLATRLAKELNGRLVLEQFADNPFLPKFYAEPARYAFPLELSFLAERFHQLKGLLSSQDLFTDLTVSDYFIDKSLIFARATLSEDEFMLYSKLFYIMQASLPRPDLLVYLYVDIPRLMENIRKRGRSYEQNVQADYLEKIQSGYIAHLKTLRDVPILIVDTTDLDFVGNADHYNKIISLFRTRYNQGITRVLP